MPAAKPTKKPSGAAPAPPPPSAPKKGNGDCTDRGIPPVDALGFLKFLPVFFLGPLITSAIGSAIAWRIYTRGNTELYDKNMAKLTEGELGYTLAAAAVFNLAVAWVNGYPMLYKTKIMRFTSGNLRANMQIYKQYGQDAGSGYVLLETQGPVGSYNRANRSLTHLVENSIPVAVLLVLCGSVFPFPTLVLTALFGVGRVLHQIGYATIGYGGHGLGFALAEVGRFAMQGLCLLAADRSLGLGAHEAAIGAAAPYYEQAATFVAPYYEQAAAAATPYVAQAAAALKIEL